MHLRKTKHVQLFQKDDQNVSFHELEKTLTISYNWLHIWGVMLIFLFKYCLKCAKTNETEECFCFSLKNKIIKIHTVFFTVLSRHRLYLC